MFRRLLRFPIVDHPPPTFHHENPMTSRAEFPEHLQILFKPKRFKVLYGGRGASRSWSVARALLLIGRERCIRVLCCRELQKSIAESVHKVLSDQIVALGLEDFYRIEVSKIYGKNGTSFAFEGIKNNTTAVKSYEGIDYCWVEEANKVTKASWNILTPTIRKESPIDWRERGMMGPEFRAEIWMTFNPDLETDYTLTRWVKDKRLKTVENVGATGQIWTYQESSDSFVVKMTWRDNPWFPTVLKEEMEATRARDVDEYLNIWEGHTVQQLEGAVYKKELQRVREDGRVMDVPYEPEVPVNTYWDLGRADKTAIWFGQEVAMQFRVLEYFEDSGEDILYYIKELQNRPYIYGTHFLPHDAKHKKLVYKHSIEEQVRTKLKSVVVLKKTSIVDRINMARMFFRKCHFDSLGTADGLGVLGRYRFAVHPSTDPERPQYSDVPLHDEASNGADAFGYMAQAYSQPQAKRGLLETLGLPPSAKRGKDRFTATAGARGEGTGWLR